MLPTYLKANFEIAMKNILIIWLSLSCCKAEKIGCGSDYDPKSWLCDEINYYFSPSNLEKTLYCIGYNKLLPKSKNLNVSDYEDTEYGDTIKPYISLDRFMHSFEKVDEDNHAIYLSERLNFLYNTNQIGLDSWDCDTYYIDIPTKYISLFIPSSFLGNGMHYKDFTEMRLHIDDGCIELQGNRLAEEPCKLDLSSYPFDQHNCTVNLHLALETDEVDLHSNENPVRSPEALWNPGWTIEVSNISIKQSNENTETYFQTWSFEIRLKRNVAGIIMHFYLPSIILCFASMMSLFIHHDLLPARMCLSVTTCLSLITLIMGAK